MIARYPILIAVCIFVASGLSSLSLRAIGKAPFEQEISAASITYKSGALYTTRLKFDSEWFLLPHDSPEGKFSRLRLYEDGVLQIGSHASHSEIASLGKGRFSHWSKQILYFSSSDGSDPRSNGKRYSVSSTIEPIAALHQITTATNVATVCSSLLLAVTVGRRFSSRRGAMGWIAGGAKGIAIFGGLIVLGMFCFPPHWSAVLERNSFYHIDGYAFGYDVRSPLPLFAISSREVPQIIGSDGEVFSMASAIQEVVVKGEGRYLADSYALAMSTVDNTDPRINGKEYSVLFRIAPALWLVAIVTFFVASLLAVTFRKLPEPKS